MQRQPKTPPGVKTAESLPGPARLAVARLSGIGQRLAFGWIGFRKAFWWVRADLLYLTEPLILLVGAGRFEGPTPCAQGGLRCASKMPCFQALTFQADTGILLKPVEPG
jgi:hypothetical protein